MRAGVAVRAPAFLLTVRAGGALRTLVFLLTVRAGVALRAAVFPLPVGAGVAVRAPVFQPAVRTGAAQHAAVFQPAVRAGVAVRAVAFHPAVGLGFRVFQLPVRAGVAVCAVLLHVAVGTRVTLLAGAFPPSVRAPLICSHYSPPRALASTLRAPRRAFDKSLLLFGCLGSFLEKWKRLLRYLFRKTPSHRALTSLRPHMLVSPEFVTRVIRLGVVPLLFWRSVRARREDAFLAASRVSHKQHLLDLENPAWRTPRGAVFVSPQVARQQHGGSENVSARAFGATLFAAGVAAAAATAPRVKDTRVVRSPQKK